LVNSDLSNEGPTAGALLPPDGILLNMVHRFVPGPEHSGRRLEFTWNLKRFRRGYHEP